MSLAWDEGGPDGASVAIYDAEHYRGGHIICSPATKAKLEALARAYLWERWRQEEQPLSNRHERRRRAALERRSR